MSSPFPPPALRELTHEVAALLQSRGETIAVAETVAGGLISASLLSFPGASAFYKGGLTLYTLESRLAFGAWTQADVDAYAGPTTGVVKGLAEKTREKLGATWVVGESGTAGPTTPPKSSPRYREPGYVALAVAGPQGTRTREVTTGLGPDREGNMVQFAVEALKLVRDVLKGEAEAEGKL